LKIIDNLLPEGDFLNDIRDDKRWQNPHPFSWCDGKQTKNLWEDLAYFVWNHIEKPDFDYAGFEYWTNPIPRKDGTDVLEWHLDKDEHAWWTHKNMVNPAIGMVYYAHTETPKGGYLEIQHEDGVERIQAVPNRLIIFDPGKYVHQVTKVLSGQRRTFASNIWIEKPSKENFV